MPQSKCDCGQEWQETAALKRAHNPLIRSTRSSRRTQLSTEEAATNETNQNLVVPEFDINQRITLKGKVTSKPRASQQLDASARMATLQ